MRLDYILNIPIYLGTGRHFGGPRSDGAGMPASTVLLAGSGKLLRAGLKRLFKGAPFTVIGEAIDWSG